MLLLIPIIIALVAGTCLLALVSDSFAYELSRGVEAAFDYAEYRAALRRERRREARRRDAQVPYEASYSHAG